jgi:hypothetical protein
MDVGQSSTRNECKKKMAMKMAKMMRGDCERERENVTHETMRREREMQLTACTSTEHVLYGLRIKD